MKNSKSGGPNEKRHWAPSYSAVPVTLLAKSLRHVTPSEMLMLRPSPIEPSRSETKQKPVGKAGVQGPSPPRVPPRPCASPAAPAASAGSPADASQPSPAAPLGAPPVDSLALGGSRMKGGCSAPQ